MATANIIVIPADEAEDVELKSIEMSLKTVQELVGGYIEPYAAAANWSIVLNEEAALEGVPVNMRAVQILDRIVGLRPGVVFRGTVLLVGTKGSEMVSVPEGLWEKINAA